MTTSKLPKLFLPLFFTLALSLSYSFADDISEPLSETLSDPTSDPASEPQAIDVSGLVDVSSTDIGFLADTIGIHNNGAVMRYEVSKSEFYLKDKMTGETNIEALAEEFGSAEEMRQFVSGEDAVWGQDCKLVLYKDGLPKTDENRCLLTHKIEIRLDREVASMELLQQLADAAGVEVGSREIGDSGTAWLSATCGGSAFKAAEILSAHASVELARPITTIPLEKTAVPPGPNDQFYNVTDQYYVHHDYPFVDTCEVWQVWCGNFPLTQRYFGRGVEISLLDDGVQGDHPDLTRSYSFRKDTDFVDGDNDGAPANFQDNHGTEMAGIIVARQNNGIGIAGIAPAATLFSTRVFGADSDPQILADAHEHESQTVDILVSGFVPGGNYVDITKLLEDAFKKMAERKDVPIVYPAGGAGGGARVDYDRVVSHRNTIATAAMFSSSEPGCSLIATGPGFIEMATTDRTGDDGDEPEDAPGNGDYMFSFGGTSAANACTAGVVALMKDARPDLGWRDYQEILLLTGYRFDPSFAWNFDAPVATPFGPLFFEPSYQWGGGFLNGNLHFPALGIVGAVALAEVWAPLPDSAALYKKVDRRKLIRDDIGATAHLQNDGTYEIDNPIRTYLFDFNRVVPSKQNMRIEHVEVRLEWEEPPSGAAAQLLPAYVHLVSPYYTNGPSNEDDINDRPGGEQLIGDPPTGIINAASLLSERDTGVNAPVEWIYTSVRHWGQVNTGGFERIGVPDQNGDRIYPAGVWELDVGVEPFIVEAPITQNPLPNHPDSRLKRRLIEAEITMYGSENNVPPVVISGTISSSGNPGVISPRTAFEDEDLSVDNIVFFDPEGDPLTVSYRWQRLDRDGLTWGDVGDPNISNSDCEYDQYAKVTVKPDTNGTIYDRYFIVYEPDGTSVAFYFEAPGSTTVPPGADQADRAVPIQGVTENEGAIGISVDIRDAVLEDANNGGPFGSVVFGNPDAGEPTWLVPGEVAILYPQAGGPIISPDPGTSLMVITAEVSQDDSGNCFGPTSDRLDASLTVAAQKYRVIVTPRDGLRDGFRYISDEIIVNSRPIYTAAHEVPYRYDADLWILTVPPEDLAAFAFINEVSQGTGDSTTNEEWVEIMVNYTADMRGFKLSNDIASFDLTFTQDPIWSEVPYGTIITIYNGEQRDPLLPSDTEYADLSTSIRWVLSSSDGVLFNLPANGDGWGEFSNIDCTPEEKECDGAHVALLTQFEARDPIHGVSFNGNLDYVNAGIAASGEELFFDGTSLVPGFQGVPPFSPTDPEGWMQELASAGTPGGVNSLNNQIIHDTIIAEAKTSIPTYRFYPGDGSQVEIDPQDGHIVGAGIPDLVPSDMVPGLSIDRKSGLISGSPDVPDGGTFTIKIQRSHSFSSEIQIYELIVLPMPPLDDDGDEDDDGLINMLEEALGTDPYAAEANILPTGQIVSAGGMNYPSLRFRRLKGGILDGETNSYTYDDLFYIVEASSDLKTWRSAPDIFVIQESVVNTEDDPENVEIATFRVVDAIGSMELGEHYYLRLSVTRLLP